MVAGSLLRYVPLPFLRTRTLSRYFGMRFLITAILVFIHSWNEFVVALNLTAKQTATVPVAIARRMLFWPAAIAVSTAVMASF